MRFIKKIIKNGLYSVANSSSAKYVLKAWQNPLSIFCFHRILPMNKIASNLNPNHELTVSAEFFNNFLENLGRSHRFCTLDESVAHLREGSKERIAHITFDDGYKDNLDYALPILERHNVPATIYITTRFAEGDAWMWWFELWDIISQSSSISYLYKNRHFKLQCKSDVEKISLFNYLRGEFSNMDISTQKEVLQSMTGSDIRKSYLDVCLQWEEIDRLDKHSLITIGSHTHSHPNLSVESDETVEYELAHSKALLESRIGRKIKHLAYPYGGEGQFGMREEKIAGRLGYQSAATTICQKWRNDNLFKLPRYFVTESSSPAILTARISGLCNLCGKQLL